MDIARIALTRHTCKAYDPTRKIAEAQVEQLKTLLRFAPSSVNSQPWHFFIAGSDAGRARLIKATSEGPYAANGAKVLNASHVVVLCARTRLDDTYLDALLAQEERDGRFPTSDHKAAQDKGRRFYADLHRVTQLDTGAWMERQVYLALGNLLLGAATLGIDATPIEGYDHAILDQELGLPAAGLKSLVMVALGYRSAEDFNAGLPKSRLSAEVVFSDL